MQAAARCERLLREIASNYACCSAETGLPAPSPAVLEALRKVPRERFVPEALAAKAYLNSALPIGEGQTISQPFIVALLCDLLHLHAGSRVLDVGTGCGYQAAVLSHLVSEVDSVEILPHLHAQAKQRLAALGYPHIRLHLGNGWHGWSAQAPYDGIVVAAAADAVPPVLVEQLAPGGRMVIPIVTDRGHDVLTLIEKSPQGVISSRRVLAVRFVPLINNPY